MRKRKTNGRRQVIPVNGREKTLQARTRLMKAALKRGSITNAQAKTLLNKAQAYYHLNKLAEAGLLKREAYDTWVPIRRRGRPVYV